MSKLISSNLKNIFFILLGNTIYALAVVMFILPSNLITGGTTGLALLFYNLFGLPINVFVSSAHSTIHSYLLCSKSCHRYRI